MRASELRIGNLINYKADSLECNFEPTVIDADFLIGILHGKYDLGVDVMPIPLTEEWLLKFGCIKTKSTNVSFSFVINPSDPFGTYHSEFIGDGVLNFDDDFYGLNLKIKYVHQLQNLIFALTGEELTIK